MKQSEKDSNGVKWITVYVLHTLQQIQTECKGMKRMADTPKRGVGGSSPLWDAS